MSDVAGTMCVPEPHWDAMFAPSSILALITTVDPTGVVNAATSGTTTRICHDPMLVSFTVDAEPISDTCANILATGEFVVNGVPFEEEMLRAARVAGLPFPSDVDELAEAGLTSTPIVTVRAPIVTEARVHFACTVEWTKRFEHRLMVCGRVVEVLIDEDCYDPRGVVLWDRLRPAHYCGAPYGGTFVGTYEPMYVERDFDVRREWRTAAPPAPDVDVLGDPGVTVEFGGEARRRPLS